MVAMATRAAVMLLLLSHHSTSLTLDGGAGWELSFSPPVIAAGAQPAVISEDETMS